MTTAVDTTCPYCGVGCGVRAQLNEPSSSAPSTDGEIDAPAAEATVSGLESHPANLGRLCSKGSALGETVAIRDRLLYPEVHGQRVSWESALDDVASGFRDSIAKYGPESVALYVSGQLLTEDYYVANKLMKGYVGTANIDTNSRLCMSSAVAGYKRAFGADTVPNCYEDLEVADLIILTGSNTAWCHPVLFQRIVRAKQARPDMKVVVIDPRRTSSCDIADLHLPIRAGSDTLLFNGLLAALADAGKVASEFVAAHTNGYLDAIAAARADAPTLETVSKICGVDVGRIREFYELFAGTERCVSFFSQGINQSSSGTDKVNSIINCHLLTGRIGKPGAGPFSITGQPNAMGGREVGGLANLLAAHMDLDNASHRQTVQTFWDSPAMASRTGLKAVDLFESIHAGRVKAVWIMATNPVVSLPNANRVREALERCPLVVVSDVVADTDTLRTAHIKLPALAWGEKNGTVTNSERRISRQRPFIEPPGESRADWWIICEVAQRMGYSGFDFSHPAEIFDEHARLSAADNNGSRDFDIGGLSGMDVDGYDALQPIQWPVRTVGDPGIARMFTDGRYFTDDGRARLVPVRHRPPASSLSEDYPLVLNTGRVRDHWHTMTRTARSPRLSAHRPEPYVEMHPRDALMSGVRDGALVRVSTRWGAMIARLRADPDVRRGAVFVPIHWNDITASDGRVGKLVNPEVDPISGEPEFKHTPCRVESFIVKWHGFILSRQALDITDSTYWVRVQGDRFFRYELAHRSAPPDWRNWGRATLPSRDDDDWLEFLDEAGGVYRTAVIRDNRIEACLFASPAPDLPSRMWLSGLFAKEMLEPMDRPGLLAGRPADAAADVGPLVCSCFGVGRKTIEGAIAGGCRTPEAVGQSLKAGTNCGSCVSEIRTLIEAVEVETVEVEA